MNRKKLPFAEGAYVAAALLACCGIALQVNADLGVSMVAAPAYILSRYFTAISHGAWECIVQGGLFVLCCVAVRRPLWKKLWSFVLAIPYGVLLDAIKALLAGVTAQSMAGRVALLLGSVITSAGIALYFRAYFPCQVYEMFVKALAEGRGLDQTKVKIAYEWCSLTISLVLSLVLFRGLVGIGVGTLVCTVINGPIIALWGKWFDALFDFTPNSELLNRVFN